jgi:hypothetical protein
MVHPVLATGPRLGRATRIEGRGKLGRLSEVTSLWDAQWKGVGWAAAGLRMGIVRGRKEGVSWAGFGFVPNSIRK